MLFDTMLAILLLSVILWALLGLFYTFRSQYVKLQSLQQTWRYAHFVLETYPDHQVVKLPPKWQKQIEVTQPAPFCEKVNVTVQSPFDQNAKLSRWYCQISEDEIERAREIR